MCGIIVRSVHFENLYLSVDKVLATLICLGCAGTLADAYVEGSRPLKGQVRATAANRCEQQHKGRGRREGHQQQDEEAEERPLLLHFNNNVELCRTLEQRGYVIIDNFLSPSQIDKALKSLSKRDDDSLFQTNDNQKHGDTVRTDKVFLFHETDAIAESSSAEKDNVNGESSSSLGGLSEIRESLYRLGYDIATSSFGGFPDSRVSYRQGWLGIPDQMQISRYDKHVETEEGGYYHAHTDTCNDSWMEMGLVGYFKSLYLRRRYITCIVYLNPSWEPEHGGCLRVFHVAAASATDDDGDGDGDSTKKNSIFVDIEPRAGRLVLFSSAAITHAVQPTFAPRFACSLWMTLNPE